MATFHLPDNAAKAAEEFNRQHNRTDGARVAACLIHGLGVLQESLYHRIYQDLQRAFARDSSLMPASEVKAQQSATEEIAAYQLAESAWAAVEFGCVGQPRDWFLRWLASLLWGPLGWEGKIVHRGRGYLPKTPDDRRLAFMGRLLQIVPVSRQAPLVLFRLLPLSIWIATACAFDDRATSLRLRHQQVSILPAIADCRHCHGQILKCHDPCPACGNPLWKHEWLSAVD